MTYNELREAVALRIYISAGGNGTAWGRSLDDAGRAGWRRRAEALISALRALGLAIVPREATDDIAEAIALQANVCGIAESVWHSAIAAGEIKPEGGNAS